MSKATSSETEVMEFIRERLSATFDIERIILFGSRARGDAEPDSDWDVLVITNSNLPFAERQANAMRCLGRRNSAVDLLVYTPLEADRSSQFLGSPLYWAELEGQVTYARA